MRQILVLIALVAFSAVPASAQTSAIQADKLGFTQAASSLAEAQAMTFKVYIDAAAAGVALVASCSGPSSPYACTAPLPPVTTGVHSSQLTSSVTLTDGRVIESVKSSVFSFRVFTAPAAPSGQTIVP